MTTALKRMDRRFYEKMRMRYMYEPRNFYVNQTFGGPFDLHVDTIAVKILDLELQDGVRIFMTPSRTLPS